MDNCKPNQYAEFFSDGSIIVGTLLLGITMKLTNTYGGLIGHMIGYGFLSAGFIVKSGILASIMASTKCKPSEPLMYFVMSVLPFIIMVCIILYILFILNTYFNRIVGGKVTKGFEIFSWMFIIVLIAQLALFYNGMNDKETKTDNVISPVYGMLIYLLSVMNIIIAITINVILAYYSTDG